MTGHPEHVTLAGTTGWLPVRPHNVPGLRTWKQRRACRKAGGHWWHPADPMIEWFCCQCGASRDGAPRDGT